MSRPASSEPVARAIPYRHSKEGEGGNHVDDRRDRRADQEVEYGRSERSIGRQLVEEAPR